MRGGNRHAFGAIHGRAAADGNQPVAAAGLVQLGGGAHGGLGRVGGRLVKHADAQAGQGVERFLQNTGGFHARIGHDQRPLNADALAFLLEQLQSTKFKLDVGEVVNQSHGFPAF